MRRVVAYLVIACGLLVGIQAMWIPVKAELAQILLERAWLRAQEGRASRPWPGADMRPVALLEVADQKMVVLGGSSGRVLAFGPGHIPSSAMPGSPGVCVIAGHRDTSFDVLASIRRGELIRMTSSRGERFAYRVTRVTQVSQAEWSAATDDQMLVLVTCVAGSRDARLVIEARTSLPGTLVAPDEGGG